MSFPVCGVDRLDPRSDRFGGVGGIGYATVLGCFPGQPDWFGRVIKPIGLTCMRDEAMEGWWDAAMVRGCV